MSKHGIYLMAHQPRPGSPALVGHPDTWPGPTQPDPNGNRAQRRAWAKRNRAEQQPLEDGVDLAHDGSHSKRSTGEEEQ